jgi:hypothetical protein
MSERPPLLSRLMWWWPPRPAATPSGRCSSTPQLLARGAGRSGHPIIGLCGEWRCGRVGVDARLAVVRMYCVHPSQAAAARAQPTFSPLSMVLMKRRSARRRGGAPEAPRLAPPTRSAPSEGVVGGVSGNCRGNGAYRALQACRMEASASRRAAKRAGLTAMEVGIGCRLGCWSGRPV